MAGECGIEKEDAQRATLKGKLLWHKASFFDVIVEIERLQTRKVEILKQINIVQAVLLGEKECQ